MDRKYLTESARITDAYAQMYSSSRKSVNESGENGNLLNSLKGQLPIDGKGSAKTGSRLGRRPMLPFDKRDKKNDCGHSIPQKKTFGFGKTTNVSTEGEGSAKTGSKLGVRKMLPFDKRDEKPTSIGRIGKVENRGCVKGIKESEDDADFEMEITDVDKMNDVEDISSEKTEECEFCSQKQEALDLALSAFDQIYDNLNDDDKNTIDEVKEEIDNILNPDSDDSEDDEIEDIEISGEEDSDDEIEDDSEVQNESYIKEGIGGKVAKKVLGAAAKKVGKLGKVTLKGVELTKCNKAIELLKKAKANPKDAELMKKAKDAYKEAMKELKTPVKKSQFSDMIKGAGIKLEKTGSNITKITSKTASNAEKAAAKSAETALKGGLEGVVTKHPVAAIGAAAATGAALKPVATHLFSKSADDTTDDVVNKAPDKVGKQAARMADNNKGNDDDTDDSASLLAKQLINLRARAKNGDKVAQDALAALNASQDSSNTSPSSSSSSDGNIGSKIGDGLGGFIGGIGNGLGGLVGGVAKGVGDGVSSIGSGIGGAISGVTGGLGNGLSSLGKGVTGAFTSDSSKKDDKKTDDSNSK